MNDPEFPVAGPVVILSENAPMESPITSTSTMWWRRQWTIGPSSANSGFRINSAGIAQEVAKVNLLPKLELQGRG